MLCVCGVTPNMRGATLRCYRWTRTATEFSVGGKALSFTADNLSDRSSSPFFQRLLYCPHFKSPPPQNAAAPPVTPSGVRHHQSLLSAHLLYIRIVSHVLLVKSEWIPKAVGVAWKRGGHLKLEEDGNWGGKEPDRGRGGRRWWTWPVRGAAVNPWRPAPLLRLAAGRRRLCCTCTCSRGRWAWPGGGRGRRRAEGGRNQRRYPPPAKAR